MSPHTLYGWGSGWIRIKSKTINFLGMAFQENNHWTHMLRHGDFMSAFRPANSKQLFGFWASTPTSLLENWSMASENWWSRLWKGWNASHDFTCLVPFECGMKEWRTPFGKKFHQAMTWKAKKLQIAQINPGALSWSSNSWADIIIVCTFYWSIYIKPSKTSKEKNHKPNHPNLRCNWTGFQQVRLESNKELTTWPAQPTRFICSQLQCIGPTDVSRPSINATRQQVERTTRHPLVVKTASPSVVLALH